MIHCNNSSDFLLLLFLFFISIVNVKTGDSLVLPEEIVSDLYSKYKEAVSDEKLKTSSRRLFKHNKEYEIHVKKLKEVNGFKKHNLVIKGNLRTGDDTANNPIIYINNPVESKIPKAYLTLEEFKEVLTNRIKLQRNESTTENGLSFIFNEAKITASGINKANSVKIQFENISKSINRFKSNLGTKERTITNYDAHKNISFNVLPQTSKIPKALKAVVTEKSMKMFPTENSDKTSASKENVTKAIESQTQNNVSESKYLASLLSAADEKAEDKISTSTEDVKTEFQTSREKIITTSIINDDKMTSSTKSLNENKLINKSELHADKDLTSFATKNDEQSIDLLKFSNQNIKSSIVSSELNSTETIPTEEIRSNVATEKITTVTEEFIAKQVSRHQVKPKRTTTRKVSPKVSRKRSTLSRPLVFMGSR